jgi:predicted nucleic acid-binding protein
MKDTYFLDACALIAFLSNEEGTDKIESILKNARKGECNLFMNKLNLLEIYYWVYREEGEEKAEEVLEKILKLPIKIIKTIRDKVFKEAGRLKATYKISLADSIVLAETLVKKARLVTSDHHEFDEVEGKEKINFHWFR